MKIKVKCISVDGSLKDEDGIRLVCKTRDNRILNVYLHDTKGVLIAADIFGLYDLIKIKTKKDKPYQFNTNLFIGTEGLIDVEPDCGGHVN